MPLNESPLMVEGEVILWVVAAVFVLSAACQLFYYLYFYLAPVYHKQDVTPSKGEPVSVIICARNEQENLERFLPSILEQDYPNFEVIVVNDCSEDDSYIILERLERIYPNLRVSTIKKDPKFAHYKKLALTIGIKAAKNELLLLTDADCQVVSNKWIESMVSGYKGETDIILGYSGFISKKGLLNRYIAYDTMFIAMQYFGLAARKLPYMGVGRNLSYKRSLFFNNGGFRSHCDLMSGDDDLFVNENAGTTNVALEFRKESFTWSVPVESWSDLVDRKRRHFTTAPHYKPAVKRILFLEPFSRLLFYASSITLVCFLFHWEIVIAVFAVRLITQIITWILSAKLFDEKNIVFFSLFFDIFSPLFNGLVYITNGRKRGYKSNWK